MEISELVGFFRQAGLAVAGGSSLWAFVFLYVARRKSKNDEGRHILEWASERLLLLFSGAFTVAMAAWLYTVLTLPVFGHEGVTLYPRLAETVGAFQLTFWIYVLWAAFSLGGLLSYLSNRERFRAFLPWFFGLQFLVVSFLISVYAWTGDPVSSVQIFYYFHGFHSIFTLGTVLTLDFTFLSIRKSRTAQRHIFPFFPQISKIIWIGLGLDFLSVALVFDQALDLGPRFFVAQTVVSILIINGAFLSGPLTRRMLGRIKDGLLPLAGRWKYIAAVCGSISIVSWLSITFIDFFPNVTLTYIQMMGIYTGVIVSAFVVNLIVERFDLGVAQVPQRNDGR